ncbi:hypothetical protein EMCRGX_G023900 [Ephydatia muelleri]
MFLTPCLLEQGRVLVTRRKYGGATGVIYPISTPTTLQLVVDVGVVICEVLELLLSEGPLARDDNSVAESESVKAASSVCVGEEDLGEEDSPGEGEEHSEEEEWLEALEAGDVDERGYLPQKKESVLTARQRAMLGTSEETGLMELPSGKPIKEMTEEMLLKKSEKNRKRRLQALKRKEKDKADTVRKLIEKQSKKKEEDKPKQPTKPAIPHIRYVNSASIGTSLSLPVGTDYPLVLHQAKVVPVQKCAIEQCSNPKRYSDSQTSLPLCSIECYRKLRSSVGLQSQHQHHPKLTIAT